MKERDGSRG